ncbi:hypothetical protein PHMEG_00020884 [Phytophthora megakarya]|uniref:Uncharacterized protein n=1 Tax=Phytophthora megakarya TaxID=4795 RepID=A0A225VMS7_9STRA|nr:hypothetical protein PHMEG_00020884 [Phytophthora megakarya]
MTVPQPIFEIVAPPRLEGWDQASLIKWRRARAQYEESVRERCQWSGEDYQRVVRGIRTAVDPDLFEFLANYEIGKNEKDITDKDILAKVKERCETMNSEYLANPSALFAQKLRMDLSVNDVPDRVAKYFRLFERIIAENGFQENLGRENLGRGSATDDNYVARMKQRTKILVDHLAPTMLREEIKGMLELVKYRHIRINDQLLYKLVLERAELQQLFYNRFKHQQKKSQRYSSDDTQHTHAGSAGEQAASASSQPTQKRPPPRTGCFHCKGEHWLKECPTATQAEKDAVRTQKPKVWKAKRAVVRQPTQETTEVELNAAANTKVLEEEEYTYSKYGMQGAP